MTRIQNMIDHIDDELCGAKEYAEKYLEYKATSNLNNNSSNSSMVANKYKEMAMDELKHAMYIHDIVLQEIEQLKTVYSPPEKMMEKWEKAHSKYVEKAAWIKQMIAL